MREDEKYVIDLCDEILGIKAKRQHRFDFLRGDTGVQLPCDAYWQELNLVVEYREHQHSERVALFDDKSTVSGCTRGEQRRQYDQRRREVLPLQGKRLVEIDYHELVHNGSKRLLCDAAHDRPIIAKKLGKQIRPATN